MAGSAGDAWKRWLDGRPAGECLLRSLRDEAASVRAELTTIAYRRLQALVDEGITLRHAWPRAWHQALAQSIGPRLYLTHAENFAPTTHWVSIVSSAWGRDRRYLTDWPTLLDRGLQWISQRRQRLLLLPGTTTFADAAEFARRAGVSCLQVELRAQSSLNAWLDLSIATQSVDELRRGLWISQPWSANERLPVPPSVESSAASSTSRRAVKKDLPLQDRVAVMLGDVILALHVRAHGTIDNLLQERLSTPEYPPGTIFCAVHDHPQTPGTNRRDSRELMQGGAVGWYLCRRGQHGRGTVLADELPCHQPPPHVQQLCGRLPPGQYASSPQARPLQQASGNAVAAPTIAAVIDRQAWPWLAHCTRGSAGPSPTESADQYRDRMWLAGQQDVPHPFRTLLQICHAQRLHRSAMMMRRGNLAVSFSAVPLPELLSRRTFRAHLGRWDWEPYGLVVRREALQAKGGRSVIYGTEEEFENLSEQDKPFFQPSSNAAAGPPSRATPRTDWSVEREWRLLEDLLLGELPEGSCFAFVRTPFEAQQLARVAPCPVYSVTD